MMKVEWILSSCSATLLGIEMNLNCNVWDLDYIKEVCSDSKSY